jgi:hypothetical protein
VGLGIGSSHPATGVFAVRDAHNHDGEFVAVHFINDAVVAGMKAVKMVMPVQLGGAGRERITHKRVNFLPTFRRASLSSPRKNVSASFLKRIVNVLSAGLPLLSRPPRKRSP